jgi:hypothetical protein
MNCASTLDGRAVNTMNLHATGDRNEAIDEVFDRERRRVL